MVMGMVLWGKLSWHPAAAAWREAAPSAPTPECIEVLRQQNGTGAYRLVGVGPEGGPILARRAPCWRVQVERTIYDRILSRLGLTGRRYYAFPPKEPGYAWVFRQEGGRGNGARSRDG
ncbi:MAG: hypothetical protein DME11_01710 [Candidatus Rokuibacteriota bacterium]|nr:MAG: hypothetical protein DME11_01710 [Candidatus Rokubacteria bacterium]